MPTKAKKIVRVPIVRKLPVQMNDKERLETGMQLATVEQEISELELEKSAAVKAFTNKLKGMLQQTRTLSELLIDDKIVKDVNCEWKLDFPQSGIKTCFRLDNNEEVDSMEMNLLDVDESQGKL